MCHVLAAAVEREPGELPEDFRAEHSDNRNTNQLMLDTNNLDLQTIRCQRSEGRQRKGFHMGLALSVGNNMIYIRNTSSLN